MAPESNILRTKSAAKIAAQRSRRARSISPELQKTLANHQLEPHIPGCTYLSAAKRLDFSQRKVNSTRLP